MRADQKFSFSNPSAQMRGCLQIPKLRAYILRLWLYNE